MASLTPHLGSLTLAGLPIGDWQFWVVTIIALAAGAFLLRPLWSKARGSGKQRRATLTIGGKPIGKDPTSPPSPPSQASPPAPSTPPSALP